MTVLNHQPHALYRFYDADGLLLYIGLTANLPSRLGQHRTDKPWWTQVASVDIEHFPTRQSVAAAERRAIADESPHYNVIHNRERDRHPLVQSGELVAVCDMCGKVVSGNKGVVHISLREVADAEKAAKQWEEENPGPLLTLSALRSSPEEASWHVHCFNCLSPQHDCTGCYWFGIERCLTWAELVDWTAHLSEKGWLESTNWMPFIRATARGTQSTGLLAVQACPVSP